MADEPVTSAAFDDAIAQIQQISELSDGLAIVIIAGPATHTTEALGRISDKLEDQREIIFHPVDVVGADLQETLTSPQRRPALLVHGFEWLLEERRMEVERHFNLARDPLSNTQALIIFWIDHSLLDEFRRFCPDLFQWRSLLLILQEEELQISDTTYLLQEYARRLQNAYTIRSDEYLEPLLRIDKRDTTVLLSNWAGIVKHGCLTGVAGSGKSSGILTYASNRVRQTSLDGGILPLLIKSHHTTVPSEDSDSLFPAMEGINDLFPQVWLLLYAKTGNLQIIIDGFDEIAHEDQQLWIGWLHRIRRRHPRVRTLVVSRPGIFPSSDWERAYVLPLSSQQIDEFLHKKIASEYERIKLRDRIKNSAQLSELASSPLFLSILIRINENRPLTDNHWHALSILVNFSMHEWDAARDLGRLRSQAAPATLRRRLASLALSMLRSGKASFRSRELAAWPQLRKDLDYLIHRTNLILEDPSGYYAFRYRALFNFLAAEAVIDQGIEASLPLIQEHRDDPTWSEVLALAVPTLLELTSDKDISWRKQLTALIPDPAQ